MCSGSRPTKEHLRRGFIGRKTRISEPGVFIQLVIVAGLQIFFAGHMRGSKSGSALAAASGGAKEGANKGAGPGTVTVASQASELIWCVSLTALHREALSIIDGVARQRGRSPSLFFSTAASHARHWTRRSARPQFQTALTTDSRQRRRECRVRRCSK